MVLKSEDEFNFDGHQGWRLSLDEECNKVIRDDFLYEQVSNMPNRITITLTYKYTMKSEIKS
jgi:hypothetical protein